MANKARPGIAIHYLRYTVGNVLIMAAGFVSFPIMTRLLDNTQYGIFGYYDTWLMMLAGVLKLGTQHSILRFYPHRGDSSALGRFGTNFILLPFLGSLTIWLLAALALLVFPRLLPATHGAVAWIVLLLLLPTMWNSTVGSVLFAEERSDLNTRVNVGSRWLEVIVILSVVYFIERSALGVYIARLAVAFAVSAGLSIWLWRRQIPMRWIDCDRRSFLEGLRYGVPMMVNELSAVALSFVDRLMLRHMLGAFAPVGIYTIGYGLALNISNMLHGALGAAYTQVSVRQFETEGPVAVVRTKRAVLHVLVYVAVAMIVGLATVGSDALLLLAGHDKVASAPVFVLIGANYMASGLFSICASGLELHKRSMTVLSMTLAATVLNIALNLVWIPQFGVMGAVYATFASSIALNGMRFAMCPRELRALPDSRATVVACGLGILAWLVAHLTGLFGISQHLLRLIVMAALMLPLYVLPALALDRRLREALLDYWKKRRARLV